MPLPFTLPSFIFGPGEMKGFAGTTPVIRYRRDTEIVEEASGAWAIRGTIEVNGQTFDTIERAGGGREAFVSLKPGTYPAKMELSPGTGLVVDKFGKGVRDDKGKWVTKKAQLNADAGQKFIPRRQIRPQHSQTKANEKTVLPILIHEGSVPSHFEGCIGVGVRSPGGLDQSHKKIEELFKVLGGFKEGTLVYLVVEGENPGLKKPGK
jgi:hypothetical protein